MSPIALIMLLSMGAFVCEAKLRAAGVRLGPSPGIVIRIRSHALDAFFDGVTTLSSKYAHKAPIPDVTATIGGIDLASKSVRITKFPKPVIRYRLTPPNGFVGSLEFPHVGIEGPFNAARRIVSFSGHSTQNDSGVVIFNATSAQVNFTCKLGEFENGIPRVDSFECASALGPANLNVRHAKEKFAIDVMTLAAKSVRPLYNSQVCSNLKKAFTTQINGLLKRLPNVLDISSSISFKYQLKPVFGHDFFEARFFGKAITDLVSPHTPAPFVEADNADAMVVILFSDSIINDVLYQLYNNEKLKVKIDANSQPLLYDLVRVDCAEGQACLGRVAPGLAAAYGNDALVRAELKAAKAPEVEFQQGKAIFTAALTTDLYLTTANDSREYHEATAAVDVTGDVQIKIKDGSLYGQVQVTNVVVHIDQEHNKKWEAKISNTIKDIVERYINSQFLHKGLPLKLPFGAGLTEPLVSFQPHTAQIHTGFVYQNNASGEKK